jgi:SAM-dependent methyltransferase
MSKLHAEKTTGADVRNPDFDDGVVVWSDAFTGRYQPVVYRDQFDAQWRLFLERKLGFHAHTGVEVSDDYIDDRIEELTGLRGVLARRKWGSLYPLVSLLHMLSGRGAGRDVGGTLLLEPYFPANFFAGKRCLDFGCGGGRWTRVLQALGGKVKSVDVSESGLESTRRFNEDTEYLDLFSVGERPDLQEAFDFTLSWGVVMCTHDPLTAFRNVSRTVRPGGHLYLMVYAPTYHASAEVRDMRRRFHRDCRSLEEKLAFVYEVAERPENAINYMDMLNTFYNWVIPEEVVYNWLRENGFGEIVTLNRNEPNNCAWHVLGRKTG